jgi:hypothetical protein
MKMTKVAPPSQVINNMQKLWGGFVWILVLGAFIIVGILLLPSFLASHYYTDNYLGGLKPYIATSTIPAINPVQHINTPESLKALYMTACVAGTPAWRQSLKELIDTTELNAIVIDIKDSTGVVSFPNDFAQLKSHSGCVVSDMKEFIASLHEANIYVIGRISVFQDPAYTKAFPDLAVKRKSDGKVWKDYKGLSFVDVGARPYWDYIINLSETAYTMGFDELNYDYVRYPSDGNMQDLSFTWTVGTTTKPEMLVSFFKYLHDHMHDSGAKLSADLFGMTTTVENDMGIGQVLENALPYFDYISPMVYPSHYPKNWNGFANPAEHPYEVIKIAMSKGVERERVWNIANGFFTVDDSGATTTPASKLRPWLQDFDLGADYGPDKIKAQIQATYDVGLTSWMLWNAGNKYTKEALLVE